MSRTKKKSVGRFLKRNTLNIAILAAIVLLVAAIFAVAVLVVELSRPAQPVSPEEPQPPAQSDEQPASELQLPVTDEPETPQEDTFTPPFDGTSELLADGRMMLTYDEKQLKLTTDGEGFYSLVGLDGAASARMDLQQLPALLSELENDELERLCIGILQAYYYLAPETQSITLTDGVRTADGYTCTLGAPAYEDAPAVTAKVRLMQLDKQLWYAIVLTPEGADGAAVLQAFDNLTLR